MKILMFFLSVMAVVVGFSSPVQAARTAPPGYYTDQKVVYHINYEDSKRQLDVLKNMQNQINAVGQDHIDLRVVLHGDGLSILQKAVQDEKFRSLVDTLRSKGALFLVCANTLKGRNIARESLYKVPEEDVVPSGIAEVVRLQGMGFSYVKP